MQKPMVTKYTESVNHTCWHVRFPDVPMKRQGAQYRVFTYPDSDLMSVVTWVKGIPISETKGHKIYPVIRAAIADAKSQIETIKPKPKQPPKSYFRPADKREHERGNNGEDVPDYCANCRVPFMEHHNGRCPS